MKAGEEVACFLFDKTNYCFNNSGSYKGDLKLPSGPNQINTQFVLFNSPSGPSQAVSYKSDAAAIKKAFVKKLPVKIIVHGFKNDITKNWLYEMKNAFLKNVTYYLLILLKSTP